MKSAEFSCNLNTILLLFNMHYIVFGIQYFYVTITLICYFHNDIVF